MDFSKVDRLEVIDGAGRAFVRYDIEVIVTLQDGLRAMKVFIRDRPEQGSREEWKQVFLS